ncbi:MAG: hypothetical protein II117_00245 [Clostridia bacterium]|nr:hypothetical protein [Clostridia bacterium]
MKLFFHKHMIVLIACTAVLCVGVLAGLVIGGTIRTSMGERTFTTVADADAATRAPEKTGETEDRTDDAPAVDQQPKPAPEKETLTLSADEIGRISQRVERRRRTIIPIRSDLWVAQNTFLWTETQPDAQQTEAARDAAEKLTAALFGKTFDELTGTGAGAAKVQAFTDPTGDRDTILRISDSQGIYLLTLRASDLTLICADLLAYPESTLSDGREKDSQAVAQKLGYSTKHHRFEKNSISDTLIETVYEFKTDSEACVTFSYIGDTLWQAAVYPSEQAMLEGEYFLADIQYDYSTPAYPQKFVEAEPPKKAENVINKEKIFASLSRMYRNLSGEKLDTSKLTATFFRDESGAREDCWKITGEGLEVVISAYSGDVISFAGVVPCKDLLNIPYEEMGGEAYEAATKTVADYLVFSLGSCTGHAKEKTVKEIDNNAVYDWHFCTMDIVLEDGTWYECYFCDGILKEIWHFANETLFMDGPSGWLADAVYINATTGKPYIPNYRDWDGDLHTVRPDNR